ncbi:MAG: MOSC domain-containing protein [Dehalococcoidia bacterium]|nr:MOSC domain-containing protein [Dehalococcoidia bacterium]MCB9486099.1 MOSC domain-containing protein [Thermoflexaceae bacterium]
MALNRIGTVSSAWRYPVKSMGGERLASAEVTLQGISADRMFAYVQATSRSPFPWLTGREMAAILQYRPEWETGDGGRPSLFVRTPSGGRFAVGSDELKSELERESGREIYFLPNYRGSFDVAAITFMTNATVNGIAELSQTPPEPGRFRMNFYVETGGNRPFQENEWVGKVLRLGDGARVAITEKDKRCAMITLAPHGGAPVTPVLAAVARENEAYAGVYGSVLTPGTVNEGDEVFVEV